MRRIIAEDLGILDDGVHKLLEKTGFPGMSVLSFAFDGDPHNKYLPERIGKNSVCYTGTHDNRPLMGMLAAMNEEEKSAFNARVRESMRKMKVRKKTDSDGALAGAVTELGFACRADAFILPMQDAALLGGAEIPSSIYIYPVDFDGKTAITDYLNEWNAMCERGETYTWTDEDGVVQSHKLTIADKITFTDTVGLIIGMVNTMIQMITIALIAFTALSLVVSTVMIGIITYVSVVERIKEIGILRAVGARKKDIKRLFNAETFIIGLGAGIIGIAITYLLSLVINLIVLFLAGIWGIAALPWWQALIMIGLSIVLTLISGLIPASAAARKDPVVALRTE